jgi:uncharacterized protein with NAD-binding domain and iron-sulfur cluster
MSNKMYDVVIAGGGISGLVTATICAEKGLKVCVLEQQKEVGGKPISFLNNCFSAPPPHPVDEKPFIPIPDKFIKLPGEHGFRSYPANYVNLRKIMGRIPHPDGGFVLDHLTDVLQAAPFSLPQISLTHPINYIMARMETFFVILALLLPYILSQPRAIELFESYSLKDLLVYQNRSKEIQETFFKISGVFVGFQPETVGAMEMANTLLNYRLASDGGRATFNMPTSMAWLNPWRTYLEGLGVVFHTSTEVVKFNTDVTRTEDPVLNYINYTANKVTSVTDSKGNEYKGKWIVSALPAEKLRTIYQYNPDIYTYEQDLWKIDKLLTRNMTGVQLFYESVVVGFDKQVVYGIMVPHPWELSFVQQNSYWQQPLPADWKPQGAGIITVYITKTYAPGLIYNKAYVDCTFDEIATEVFTAIENNLISRGFTIPKRVGYAVDNTTYINDGKILDNNRIFVPTPNSWYDRPLPDTILFNNFLMTGDYTLTNHTYYASTMESATESGLRTSAAILESMGLQPEIVQDTPVQWYIGLLRLIDAILYKFCIPNPLYLLYRFLAKFLNTSTVNPADPFIVTYGAYK